MRAAALITLIGLSLAACDNDSVSFVVLAEDDRDPSVARLWNEVLLEGIRNDFARPTVHARNLWHVSAAMYDAWAAYGDTSTTWLLGRTQNSYDCAFAAPSFPRDRFVAREQAISFAAYRIITHRFGQSPGAAATIALADDLMDTLGYDKGDLGTDYAFGSPAALGNYIADCYIAYGLADGANEANGYAAIDYAPFNPPIEVEEPGNPNIIDLNRWQQIALTLAIDQSGNVVQATPPFVSPEWGAVDPFAMTAADRTVCSRAGFDYPVFHDPGPPPMIGGPQFDEYKWSHTLVAIWSSHLDPRPTGNGLGSSLIDISPASIGNIQSYPTTFDDHRNFYDRLLGGSPDTGYTVNPVTGAPYAPQIVPLADYARVIAEFWADGPDSETPPGHWFVIANTVSDHPQLEKRFEGAGRVLGPLEWDVKLYFALGGAMHDAAIAAWSVKGCYDYVRPVSAIRAMADLGQSSDPMLPSYHVDGIPLEPGYIELVDAADPLADDPDVPGADTLNAGKIKLLAWRGPDFIGNPNFDVAGVDWILAENWWPYQRPTFVTPPFAGYVSGHSTYSRSAAEVLTRFTGDEYFPGGKSDFPAPMNQFLVFEAGPSVDITLEWAKYFDASDQCSLSRIWGGIHPPVDDMPGRLMGMQIGPAAFLRAREYINGML